MKKYQRPAVIATYSFDSLRAEASGVVACSYAGTTTVKSV